MDIRRRQSPSSTLAPARKHARRTRSSGFSSSVIRRRRHRTGNRTRQRRRKRVPRRAHRKDGRLRRGGGIRRRGVGVWVQHARDEVHDAVGEQDVGLHNLRRVDVLVVAGLADDERLRGGAGGVLGQRLEARAVGQRGRDEHLVGHDVVAHDAGEGPGVEVLERAADGGEGAVHGGEDGDVLLVRDLGHELARVEAAEEVGHVERLGGVFDARGRDQQVVDDLDEAALEVDVALDQRAAGAHAGGEDDGVAGLLGDEDVLAKRHVGVARAGEQRGPHICWARVEAGGGDGPQEDVVLQERHSGGLVIWIPDAIEGGIGDVFEGLV